MKRRILLLLIVFAFIVTMIQPANAAPVTGTAILRDAPAGSYSTGAPFFYLLALPKGSCDIVIVGTAAGAIYDSVFVATVNKLSHFFGNFNNNNNNQNRPSNNQICYGLGYPNNGYYISGSFYCNATVSVSDTLPFLYIYFATSSNGAYFDNTYTAPSDNWGSISQLLNITYLSVSYSCQ